MVQPDLEFFGKMIEVGGVGKGMSIMQVVGAQKVKVRGSQSESGGAELGKNKRGGGLLSAQQVREDHHWGGSPGRDCEDAKEEATRCEVAESSGRRRSRCEAPVSGSGLESKKFLGQCACSTVNKWAVQECIHLRI